jgi:Zn-finger nucleic acid-binding protein
MNCPSCSTLLLLSDKHGVEIDYCPKCRGIWLDRGELEKIIERELSMSSQKIRYNNNDNDDRHDRRKDDHDNYGQNYDNDDHNNYGHNNKNKKRGFLSDLFDF